mmetsp:Transcript_1680/g.2975  ORF Transcript_1680/g.2975 Transcript_1680/m.2975 type:complete len:90 (+) Transcript_1680:738-1007(+)
MLYNRGSPRHQLLLRSHLCSCIENFRSLYPQAKFVSIVRHPVDVLESFAGLSTNAIRSSMNFDLLNSLAEENDVHYCAGLTCSLKSYRT